VVETVGKWVEEYKRRTKELTNLEKPNPIKTVQTKVQIKRKKIKKKIKKTITKMKTKKK
jgi:hypothetical protein